MNARPSRFFLGAGTASLALALGGAPVLAMIPAASAQGTTGKGTITVHDASTGIEVKANNPKVCGFRLVAANYPASKTSFSYDFEDKSSGALHVSPGVIVLSGGQGESDVLWLTKGDTYKPHGAGPDENGKDNFKVFKETCDAPVTGGTTGGTTSGTTGTTSGGDTGGTTGTTSGGDTGGTTGTTSGGDTGGTTGTTGTTSGGDTGGTTGTTGTTSGGTTGGDQGTTGTTSGGTTGGDQGTTGVFTGGGTGGGTSVPTAPKPVAKHHVTRGGGRIAAAKTLPFTGSNTGSLALWALASIAGGVGFCSLGQKRGKHAR